MTLSECWSVHSSLYIIMVLEHFPLCLDSSVQSKLTVQTFFLSLATCRKCNASVHVCVLYNQSGIAREGLMELEHPTALLASLQ